MRFFRLRLVRLILTIIGIFVVVTTLLSLRDVLGKRGIVESRNQELEEAKAENARLKKQLVEVKSPGFVEKEARNKLGLVKPGEVVLVMPEAKGAGSSEKVVQVQTNWEQWWRLFF